MATDPATTEKMENVCEDICFGRRPFDLTGEALCDRCGSSEADHGTSPCFLIQHPSGGINGRKTTNLVFDLGLKRDLAKHPPAMAGHISQRHPIITSPEAAESLRAAGLSPASDIDVVVMSHVHWDHIGSPEDFPNSKFVVGSGTMHLLEHGAPPHYLPRFSTGILFRRSCLRATSSQGDR
jgi:glyoxylase-like metal-dependent hydrolase (beta-lactamase superfamily II)